MRESIAESPAGISSIFEICTHDKHGRRIRNPSLIGARGGGFAIKKGVHSSVSCRKSRKTRIAIRINSRPQIAPTTRWAIQSLLKHYDMTLEVMVNLEIGVPIGAGYGTSAAGTAATCLALTDAAQLSITFNEIGKLTHVTEVINKTGLGTASAVLVGGFVLVTEPGAPGIGEVDRLPFPKQHSMICVYMQSLPTSKMLTQLDIASQVNPAGRAALRAIKRNPCLSTFLVEARRFATKTPFQTAETSRIMEIMIANGAVGAAQNMVGQAVHGVAENQLIPKIVSEVRKKFRHAEIFVSCLDDRGVRLVDN